MSLSVTTPYNATSEALFLFNKQCINYTGPLWSLRSQDDLSGTISKLVNNNLQRDILILTNEYGLTNRNRELKEFSANLLKQAFNASNTASKSAGMLFEAGKASQVSTQFSALYLRFRQSKSYSELKKAIEALKSAHFISSKAKIIEPNINEMTLAQFQKINYFIRDAYARDTPVRYFNLQPDFRSNEGNENGVLGNVFISPLYRADIETIEERQEDEIKRYYKEEKQKHLKAYPALKLDKCLNINMEVYPLRDSSIDKENGCYHFVRSCLSLGASDFLEKVDNCLAFSKLKIIETGISTSLLIYDEEGNPFAIFKPSSFAGGSLDNPKGTQVQVSADRVEQAALKEVAAARVMNSVSGAPETHLVEINLGGKILKGSLQKYVPHNLSALDLMAKIYAHAAEALRFDLPEELIKKMMKGEPVSPDKMQNALSMFMQFSSKANMTSKGKYITNEVAKTIGMIQPEELQRVGLHQLITGNSDCNYENFLLTQTADRWRQLTPVDFNLAFQKERTLRFSLLQLCFWYSHPFSKMAMDPALVNYFKEYNVNHMANQLRDIGLDEERVVNFILRATLVQGAVLRGLTLPEIAGFFVPIKLVVSEKTGQLQIAETLSEKLIGPFYKEYDQAKTDAERKEVLKSFQEKADQEMEAFVNRLSDPKSDESKMRRLQTSELNSNSLEEFDLIIQEFNDLMGLHHAMLNFEYASKEEIEADRNKVCLNDLL